MRVIGPLANGSKGESQLDKLGWGSVLKIGGHAAHFWGQGFSAETNLKSQDFVQVLIKLPSGLNGSTLGGWVGFHVCSRFHFEMIMKGDWVILKVSKLSGDSVNLDFMAKKIITSLKRMLSFMKWCQRLAVKCVLY